MMQFRKILALSLITLSSVFVFTGCGSLTEETPAAGVSIAGAENQTLGFTYLYDLGNGYKLYADNFTKVVYLRFDYSGGTGATSVGSSSMTPYISPNGNYYKVNPQTRVIEEYIPINVNTNTTGENVVITDENKPVEETTPTEQTPQKEQSIEDILNENSQKNQNSNNQQKIESGTVSVEQQNTTTTETTEQNQ